MKAIFISDAHLRKSSDERHEKLINFFDDIQKGNIHALIEADKKITDKAFIDDLFIAGDLFDFWFCRKEKINPEFKPIINKLIELKKTGIRVHLCEGNHDFFMKEYFHDVLGMEVYEETANIKLDDLNALVAHGDTADFANSSYLFLRKVLRSRAFYNFQRSLPASIRWTIARLCSTTSKELTVENGDALLKKMSSFASTKFREGFDAVILGHCHVPSVNCYTIEGKRKMFVTLGDWMKHYSFVYYGNNEFSLHHYR